MWLKFEAIWDGLRTFKKKSLQKEEEKHCKDISQEDNWVWKYKMIWCNSNIRTFKKIWEKKSVICSSPLTVLKLRSDVTWEGTLQELFTWSDLIWKDDLIWLRWFDVTTLGTFENVWDN